MYDNFRITATQLFALIFLLFVGLVWRRLHKKAVDLLSYLLNVHNSNRTQQDNFLCSID